MLIIPAIDIRGGRVVRLARGDYSRETVYSDSPLKVAQRWDSYGVKMIHVVDLDGALEGKLKNLKDIFEIAGKIKARVELGGGIRDEETITRLIDGGIEKVVVGSMLLDKNVLKALALRFRERVVAAVDAKSGIVRTKGWLFNTKVNVAAFVKSLEGAGIRTINYTDISRDGMMKGPDTRAIEEILKITKRKVVASGGVSSIDDIRALKALGKGGPAGVIVGKALYENKIDLAEAIRAADAY